jgi:hypothetical protein
VARHLIFRARKPRPVQEQRHDYTPPVGLFSGLASDDVAMVALRTRPVLSLATWHLGEARTCASIVMMHLPDSIGGCMVCSSGEKRRRVTRLHRRFAPDPTIEKRWVVGTRLTICLRLAAGPGKCRCGPRASMEHPQLPHCACGSHANRFPAHL